MTGTGLLIDDWTLGQDVLILAVMTLLRSQEADPAVAVLGVINLHELLHQASSKDRVSCMVRMRSVVPVGSRAGQNEPVGPLDQHCERGSG